MFLSTQWQMWAQNIVLIGAAVAALSLLASKTWTFGQRAWHLARKEMREAIAEDTSEMFDTLHRRLDTTDENLEMSHRQLTAIHVRLAHVHERMDGQDEQLALMSKELMFNHGSSLKDAVFEIRTQLETNHLEPDEGKKK